MPSSARNAPTRFSDGRLAPGAPQAGVDDVVHQRRLARSAHAGHARQGAERKRHVHVLQVVRGRAGDADALTGAATPQRGHRDRQLAAQVLGGQRPGVAGEPVERALVDHAAAVLAGPQPQIDDVVGDRDHVGVVLDDQHGVALVAQLPQDRDEPQVVARMQADGRLVQHVQRVDQRRAQRRGQVDALRLAARQRRRQPVQRQVVQADVAEEAQPLDDLAQHLVGNRGVLLAKRERAEELLRLADRHRRGAVDGLARHAHVARLAAQPRAAAVRARQVAAIAAQEHADVHLVLLALEPREEPADARVVAAVALDDDAALLVGEILPGRVEPDVQPLGVALERGQLRAVVRLGPRLDRAAANRLGLVGHHQVEVELDDVAEAVAGRARAKRVVEREQPRLRVLVQDVAPAALEPLAELVDDGRRRPRSAPARRAKAAPPPSRYAVSIESVSRACASASTTTRSTTTSSVVGLPRAATSTSSRVTARPSTSRRRNPRLARLCSVSRSGSVRPARTGRGRLHRLAVFQVGRRRRVGHADDGHLEAHEQPRALGQRRQAPRDHLGRLARDLVAAVAAEGVPDARPEQAHVVVDLGRGADGRPRIADAVLLSNRDRRADALDPVDVGLLHPLEELAGVGRQRLDVAPLAFGVDRVEGERRLARAADAGDDDQRAERQRDVCVLEIVCACAANHQLRGRAHDRIRHQAHPPAGSNP